MGKAVKSRHGEVKSDWSTNAGGREPDTVLNFATGAENLSDLKSPSGIGGRKTYCSENVPTAVREAASPMT